MNKKRCAFVVAVVVAVCAVAFLCRDRSPVETERTVLSSVSAPAAKAPVVMSSGVAPAVVLQPSSNQTATVRGTKPYVLTSEKRFGTSLRLAAEALGARTLGLQSKHALLIEADAATCARLAADSRFTSVDEFLPADKVAPGLAAALAAGAKSVEASIITLSPEDRQIVLDRIASRGGEVLTGCLNDGDTFSVRLPAELVADLAANGDVRWMEQFVRPQFLNDLAVEPKTMDIRSIWKSEENPGGLSGAGQIVSTSDTGIDSGDLETLHEDLRDRVLGMKVFTDCNPTDSNGHGTHTAGSIVGNGNKSDGKIRGTAWGANLYAWFCCGADGYVYTPSSYDELFRGNTEGTEWDAYIHSASWGSSTAGEYSARCRSMDQWVWNHPEFLPVYSAGNDGRKGVRTIGDPAAAKNVLTVGATQNLRTGHDGGWGNGDPVKTAVFSSRGPCQDGRIKPDISAPGAGILSTRSHGVDYSYGIYDEFYAFDSGTSMSCPLTAGAVALVREWLVERRGFSDVKPTAALMKAVITGGAKGAAIPNNNQGWGRVDLSETLFPSNRAVKLVDRIPFAEGEELTWIVETTNGAPLDVQLAWIDYPGSATGSQSAPKLVNDLDLTVEPLKTGSGPLYGNGGTEPDELNNMESVHFTKAEPDKYLITVNCKSVLHDWTEGGAAALYVRGAFDPDVTPDDPEYVRNARTGKFYISLDKALGEVEGGDTIEVLEPVALKKSVMIPVNCTITATNESALASLVTCREGAALTVAAGARVLFTNIAFANADESPVTLTAESGGTIAVKGFVGINRVETSSATGFELAGRLDEAVSFVVNCAGQDQINDIFGIATVSLAELGGCANQVIHPFDEDLGGEAVENSGVKLRWGLVPVPDSAAVVRLVQDGTSVNFRSMAKLVQSGYLTNDAAIEVCKDCEMTVPFKVTKNLTITSSNGTHAVSAPNLKKATAFEITGGTLTVSNVVFRNHTGTGLMTVQGESTELVLGAGARLTELQETGNEIGVVTASAGATVTLLDGCEIDQCTGTRSGAVALLDCEGCTLNLFGGYIHDCVTTEYGGGIYSGYGTTFNVKGNVRVKGNVQQPYNPSSAKPDDIYFYSNYDFEDEPNLLNVVGEITSADWSIGFYSSEEDNNVEGAVFAVAEGVDADAVAAKFFCNVPMENGNTLVGAVGEDGQTLVWQDGGRGVDPATAKVLVIYPDATTNHFLNVEDALDSLIPEDEVTVELKEDLPFEADLKVSSRSVLLRSQSMTLTLTRSGDFALSVEKGASLTITNLVVDGGTQTATKALVQVNGGALVLENGGRIQNAVCTEEYCGAGVFADGGAFTMKAGASVFNCAAVSASGEGAGLWTSGTRVRLEGGMISDCSAAAGGGAYCYDGSVSVSGSVRIDGNLNKPDVEDGNRAPNLGVNGTSVICLTGDFTGSIGVDVYDGVDSIRDVFGSVDADYLASADVQKLIDGAAKFRYDGTNETVTGCVVTNGTSGLLVWCSALKTDPDTKEAYYEDGEGTRYGLVGGDVPPAPVIVEPDPIAFESITRVSDVEWELVVTNIVPYCNYRLLWTKDLTKGFTSTGAWAQAAADAPQAWTTNVVTEGGAWFWRAEGKEGEVVK